MEMQNPLAYKIVQANSTCSNLPRMLEMIIWSCCQVWNRRQPSPPPCLSQALPQSTHSQVTATSGCQPGIHRVNLVILWRAHLIWLCFVHLYCTHFQRPASKVFPMHPPRWLLVKQANERKVNKVWVGLGPQQKKKRKSRRWWALPSALT